MREIAEDMALARGLQIATDDALEVARVAGLSRTLAVLEWRGLTRHVGDGVELTEAGAAVADDCSLVTLREMTRQAAKPSKW